MITKLQSIDVSKLEKYKKYYDEIHELVCNGDYKPTDFEKHKIRMASGYWGLQDKTPSQNPAHHANDIANVRKVGLSKFLQDLSNYFARL